ncbi:MAG: glycosyltransferase family 2 protein [Actinomycetota bacterium]
MARRRVAGSTARECAPIRAYRQDPCSAIVIQTHNKAKNLPMLIECARRAGAEELVVIDDGSADGSLSIVQDLLRGRNEFALRSNDLFEIRMYNRALSFTRAEYVALLQDDDIALPGDDDWLVNAIGLFTQHERLAVLGGRDALALHVQDDMRVGYRATGTGDFSFAEYVNRAPFIVRKSAWSDLGGFDEGFAPFQCDDVDFCIRAWLNGWHVGHRAMPFVRDVGVGGMRLLSDERRAGQMARNWAIIADRYTGAISSGELRSLVEAATTTSIRTGGPHVR